MRQWTKRQYADALGNYDAGRWEITNGHLVFSVHLTIDGSIDKRRADADGFIVSPAVADEYAEKIVKALNACRVDVDA